MKTTGLNRKTTLLPAIAAAICGIVILLTLNVPRSVGVSNNGDFTRVIQPAGIAYTDGNPNYGVYTPHFTIQPVSGATALAKLKHFLVPDYAQFHYLSTQTIPILLTKAASAAADKLTGQPVSAYNLFWMGLLYTLVFSFSIYLILKYLLRRFRFYVFLAGAAVLLFVFCDQAYTLYFNSFYGEATQYVATFLCLGLFVNLPYRQRHALLHYVFYYLAVALMALSKYAYAPVGVLFALLPLVYVIRKKRLLVPVVAMTAVSAVCFMLFATVGVPTFIREDTAFDTVFSGALKFSQTPEQDLESMGLDPSLAVLQDREAYQSDYPIDITSQWFREHFYDEISQTTLLKFYVTHPGRFFGAMRFTAQYTQYIRPIYLSAVQNPASPGQQPAGFNLWEPLRIHLPFHTLWFIAPFLMLLTGLCVGKLRRGEPLAWLGLALILACLFNFVTPYLGNGICDIAKHLFGYIHLFDILLFAGLLYLVSAVARLVRRRTSPARP